MTHFQKHIYEVVGTVVGTVLGFFEAWDLTKFTDELRTAKLAAIGAVVGFAVTSLLKFALKGIRQLITKWKS